MWIESACDWNLKHVSAYLIHTGITHSDTWYRNLICWSNKSHLQKMEQVKLKASAVRDKKKIKSSAFFLLGKCSNSIQWHKNKAPVILQLRLGNWQNCTTNFQAFLHFSTFFFYILHKHTSNSSIRIKILYMVWTRPDGVKCCYFGPPSFNFPTVIFNLPTLGQEGKKQPPNHRVTVSILTACL